MCIQANGFPGGVEDCLYLNVYTPAIDTNESLPVMFWIHGGAFAKGHGGAEMHGPDYFMDKDVVLVTINYRLGILGKYRKQSWCTRNGRKQQWKGTQAPDIPPLSSAR